MKKQRITIEGDRYLIYYTFDDEALAAHKSETEEGQESARCQETEGESDSRSS